MADQGIEPSRVGRSTFGAGSYWPFWCEINSPKM